MFCLNIVFPIHPLTTIPSLMFPIPCSFFVHKVILIIVYILPTCLFHILYFISCSDLQGHVNSRSVGTLVFIFTVFFSTTRMMGGTVDTL